MLSRLFYRWERTLSQRDTNRTVRPFEWGLDFIEGGLVSENPKLQLLEYARRAVSESDAYHAYEPVQDWRLDGNHLTFTTPSPTPYPRNNTVHGWHFPVDSGGRVVLVLPQWNADAQGHMALCRMLNGFGLSALRLSLPYHDLRMPEELERADYMLSPNLGRTLQSVRQAVVDSRAALDWLESQGYTRFAILGTSIGSCIALITLAHDSRLALGVLNHVSPYFADVVWRGISTRHVRKGLDGNIELEDLREIWMPISPRAYFKKLVGTGKKSLLVHALYDFTFPHDLSVEVLKDYSALRLPHSALALYCGHYTSGVFPFNIVLGYRMCSYIRKNL
ncbi:MAG: abhydrolase domain-containing 18 [Acidobacteriota bacterium]|nr:abhydrolase domain-containing 18 [Acidobacteriota bacterium]